MMRPVRPKPKRTLARLSVAVRYVGVQPKTAESPTDNASEAPVSRVKLATVPRCTTGTGSLSARCSGPGESPVAPVVRGAAPPPDVAVALHRTPGWAGVPL